MAYTLLTLAVLAAIAGLLYNPIALRAEVLGATRPLSSFKNIHGEELRIIPDTLICEDLHLHKESGLLFTACEGNYEDRFKWFPPYVASALESPIHLFCLREDIYIYF
jgi:hypothetical protein